MTVNRLRHSELNHGDFAHLSGASSRQQPRQMDRGTADSWAKALQPTIAAVKAAAGETTPRCSSDRDAIADSFVSAMAAVATERACSRS